MLPIFQTYISIWCFLGFLIVILILLNLETGNLASSRQFHVFASPCFCLSLSDGYFYTASLAAKDQNQQHVATCCRCVASRKAQRNPCKMGFVAVLPIFRTSIYKYDLSGDF
jgi:hypothetical protein